jgi:hypothetical protein
MHWRPDRAGRLTDNRSAATVPVTLQDQLNVAPLRIPQLYDQIADRLRGEIASGALAPGTRLPSERELARALEVSRPACARRSPR